MADFYGTLAGFKAYFTARGNLIAVASDDDDVNAALIVASEWLDAAYHSQFMGLKAGGQSQVRDWPRSGAIDYYGYSVDSSSVPFQVEYATYEAAFRQIVTPGIFFKDYSPSKYASVNISGALAVSYRIGAASDFQVEFPQIAAAIGPVLTGLGTGAFSSLSGGVGRS